MSDRRESWSRREFVGELTLAGTARFFGVPPERVAAEPPPETTRIRLATTGAICMAPYFVAEDLLRSEGFADVQYLPRPDVAAAEQALAAGEADLNVTYALRLVARLDAGDPVVVLAGVHVGCVELFGSDRVRAIGDSRANGSRWE
jgi:NitT/TauT family transport system substrate-binding protein